MDGEGPQQPQRPRTPRQIESAIEQRIREAAEAGAFDNLSTKGKPLQLDLKDAYDPEAWFVNRTMKTLGAVPPWMELAKEIDADDDRLRWMAADFARWLDETRTELLPLGIAERTARRAAVELRFEDRITRCRAQAEKLRRLIDRFNFEVPVRALEKPGVWVAHELHRLQEPFAALCAELGWDTPAEATLPATESPAVADDEGSGEPAGGRRLLDLWRRAGRR
ncbi:MAG: DnaJ family domain-containing protein [Dehalococcoidia bacterium]